MCISSYKYKTNELNMWYDCQSKILFNHEE